MAGGNMTKSERVKWARAGARKAKSKADKAWFKAHADGAKAGKKKKKAVKTKTARRGVAAKKVSASKKAKKTRRSI